MASKVLFNMVRCALAVAFGVLLSGDAFAAAIWTNAASGFWRDSTNWSGGTLPSFGTVYVTNAITKTVTIDALAQPANLVINSLNVWAPTNATNTLLLSDVGVNRPLMASNSNVEIRMRGALEITNSSLVVTSHVAGSVSLNIWAGSITLDSGSIVVRESFTNTSVLNVTRVGRTNIATLNINGGSMLSSMMQVGEAGALNARSQGTIRMTGGLLTIPGELSVGNSLSCTGIVDMAGGQIIVPNNLTNITRVGDKGVGLMVVSNASVSVGNVSVGRHDSSQGTLVMLDNGLLNASDDFSIGRFGNSTGLVFMAGGQFTVTDHPLWVGREGNGQLVVSNGLVSTPAFRVAAELTNTASGYMLIAGGTTIASSNLIIGNIGFSTGQVAVVGGSLLVSNVDQTAVLNVAGGAITVDGGTVFADSLVLTNETGVMMINSGSFISSGTIVSNGQPFVIGDGTNAAVMELRGGTHVFADGLVISPNATLTGCGAIIGTIENNGTNDLNCDGPGLHPFIIQQPANQTTTAGNMAAFNVVAVSGAVVTYQWRFGGNALPGAFGDTFSIVSAQPSDVGGYDVVVSNDSGSVTSRVATLTLANAPVITVQPATQSVPQNSPVTLTVTAVGTAPLNYQWLINSNVISGATSNTFTLPSAQPADSGDYNVVVSNPVGTVTSLVATILVLVPPTISVQPVSQNISSNSPATFSVTAAGSPTLLYQWRFNGSAIAGATDPNFSLASAQLTNAGFYSVVIRNPAGVITSEVANLTFLGPPIIIVPPASQTNARNASVTFSVIASGTSPLSYRWRFNNSNINNATNSTYTRSGLGSGDAGNYTVVVTNSSGAVTSQVAVLTVLTVVSISTQPSSQTATQGMTAAVRVVASGSAPLSYQWRFAPVGQAETVISGATSATLTLTNPQPTNSGSYRVVVSNPVSAVTSKVATVTVLIPPAITQQAQSLTVQIGTNVTFGVTATGSSLSYQWRKNGTAIPGAISTNLLLAGVQATNAGTYTVLVSNPVGSVVSTGAVLRVLVSPQLVSITTSNGTAWISFQSLSGLNYVLEFKNHLEDAVWTPLAPVPGNGGTLTLTDPTATVATRFYRVRAQ